MHLASSLYHTTLQLHHYSTYITLLTVPWTQPPEMTEDFFCVLEQCKCLFQICCQWPSYQPETSSPMGSPPYIRDLQGSTVPLSREPISSRCSRRACRETSLLLCDFLGFQFLQRLIHLDGHWIRKDTRVYTSTLWHDHFLTRF